MSNEETINSLKKLKTFHNGSYGTAIDMAIKALEQQPCEEIHGSTYGGVSWGGTYKPQQPCEDCISRKRLIILVDEGAELHPYKVVGDSETYSNYNQGWTDAFDWLYANIDSDNLPSVIPQISWIPVSEKMPDINIHVLAQFVMGGMAECYYAHNWWHIVGGFRISGDEVIAWMPLPSSYQGE